jgi:hypothetical protein
MPQPWSRDSTRLAPASPVRVAAEAARFMVDGGAVRLPIDRCPDEAGVACAVNWCCAECVESFVGLAGDVGIGYLSRWIEASRVVHNVQPSLEKLSYRLTERDMPNREIAIERRTDS